ncbi:MAG: hypothetical protein AAFR79_08135 [Pseudomonadota bacterium]
MKKRGNTKAGAKSGKPAKTPNPSPRPRKARSRREVLTAAASWGAIAFGVGGVGYWTVSSVSASMSEGDLSRIGNGTPSVVQIHDPQCSECAALQRAAREALTGFEDGALTFMVANLRTAEGRALAARHNVGHVTLLLFDRSGEMRSVIRGVHPSATLQRAFETHLRLSTS